MASIKTLMLRAPGTNCDGETAFALEQAGSQVESVHINELLHRTKLLSDYQIMVIPGGFTYGDDISGGKILANELRLKLGEEMRKLVADGRLILGICNGFQVMVKAGILPELSPQLTLASNDSGRFECRWVYLRVNETSPCIFTRGIDMMYLPVAHGEGKVVTEPGIPNIALRYADETGNTNASYPYNPNGSVDNIAGICDASGRIFALMPHPERFIRWTQHPRWTREPAKERGDGFRIFKNAVAWAKTI
ncbi:MAG: phosphoribosylformylglycinamidine synthase I [Dehalococcoidia bacterium]|nr:phosphoribosylformylglycinamidine synthase I [Dehalococcoidia bacterium]